MELQPSNRRWEALSAVAWEEAPEQDVKYRKGMMDLLAPYSGSGFDQLAAALTTAKGSELDNNILVSEALMYAALVNYEDKGDFFLMQLQAIARDDCVHGLRMLRVYINEYYRKLLPAVRKRIVVLVNLLVASSVPNSHKVCIDLLRQCSGGNVTSVNVVLCEDLLTLFDTNRAWLLSNPDLMLFAFYSFLRLIPDHMKSQYELLRAREIEFCLSIWKERFLDCISIGRDLLRALQDVSQLPQFIEVWQQLIHAPRTLNAEFSGVEQLLAMDTPKRYLQNRLTPQMEQWLLFLMQKVNNQSRSRHMMWFQEQFLSAPESENLLPDLCRFVICAFHPSNELLASEMTPRYQVLTFFFRCARSPAVVANIQLAILFDWLLYHKHRGNIMHIEPAFLLMANSLKPIPIITFQLLETLCLLTKHYLPRYSQAIQDGITCAFETILAKRVTTSLKTVLNTKLPPFLRRLFATTFPTIATSCFSEDDLKVDAVPLISAATVIEHATVSLNHGDISVAASTTTSNSNSAPAELELSLDLVKREFTNADAGEKELVAKLLKGVQRGLAASLDDQPRAGAVAWFSAAQCLSRLNRTGVYSQSPSFQFIFTNVFQRLQADADTELQRTHLPTMLTLLKLPVKTPRASLGENEPQIFRLFFLCSSVSEQSGNAASNAMNRRVWKQLLEIWPALPYWLIVDAVLSEKYSEALFDLYLSKAEQRGLAIAAAIDADLRLCQDENSELFYALFPHLVTYRPHWCTSCLQLVVSGMDSKQLYIYEQNLRLSRFKLFSKETLLEETLPQLVASLQWETFEQICLWQLMNAQFEGSTDVVICVVQIVLAAVMNGDDDYECPEALSGIMKLLCSVSPNSDVLVSLFHIVKCTPEYVLAVLASWIRQQEQYQHDQAVLAGMLVSLITTLTRAEMQDSQQDFSHSGWELMNACYVNVLAESNASPLRQLFLHNMVTARLFSHNESLLSAQLPALASYRRSLESDASQPVERPKRHRSPASEYEDEDAPNESAEPAKNQKKKSAKLDSTPSDRHEEENNDVIVIE